ncbi:thiamine-phosphate diphosphorylase [Vibrio sp. ZSDZ65]|uniref:Thiamine-phosphate diphosphorylase n=2 Tax=Vibrio qingdaonensis TaxID=2829491 RepID=A0A9X3CMZ2_9VIBR|nr:thiamine-phosphate diphosphorylase [Vibrio qingdaonensis]MCW8346424.1 thiamine-phosphate diphosphorylase [Vibrio qingdaonensis]
MNKERIKREHDLLKLNCVSDNEFKSRMAIWDSLAFAPAPLEEAKTFINTVFGKLQQDVKEAHHELSLSHSEFVTFATEEITYIRNNVANQTTQYIWYAVIALTTACIIAICL